MKSAKVIAETGETITAHVARQPWTVLALYVFTRSVVPPMDREFITILKASCCGRMLKEPNDIRDNRYLREEHL
jgi:hypothetical protein